jgi:hypothetical protein
MHVDCVLPVRINVLSVVLLVPLRLCCVPKLLVHSIVEVIGSNCADASCKSRQLLVPRRALVRAGLYPGQGGGQGQEQAGVDAADGAADFWSSVDDDMSSAEPAPGGVDDDALLSAGESGEQESGMEVDDRGQEGEEPLVPVHFQPVLTEWTCDWPGRCKLTQWAGHSAQFNGGWCMCNQKGKSAQACLSYQFVLPACCVHSLGMTEN